MKDKFWLEHFTSNVKVQFQTPNKVQTAQ